MGDITPFLAEQPAASAHLVIAADVFAYIADFAEVCAAVARVLAPGGLFGFTVETHEGEGAIVGPKMRYAHSADFVTRCDRAGGADPDRADARLLAHGKPCAGSGAAGAGAPMTTQAARLTSVGGREAYFGVLDRPAELPEVFTRWFASRGWAPRAHQLELLRLARAGRSALLIAPTGAGKTLAGFLPTLVELSGSQARPGDLACLPTSSRRS